jgi:hypothetical protein
MQLLISWTSKFIASDTYMHTWTVCDHYTNLLSVNSYLKMAVFCAVVPCSLVVVYRHFIHHQPDDGSSKHLWSISKFLRDYTVQPKRQPSYARHHENLKSHLIHICLLVYLMTFSHLLRSYSTEWEEWLCQSILIGTFCCSMASSKHTLIYDNFKHRDNDIMSIDHVTWWPYSVLPNVCTQNKLSWN